MAISTLGTVTNIFQELDILDATKFNNNYSECVVRIDELVNKVNSYDSTVDGTSGADSIGATAVAGLTGSTVQALVESLKSFVDAGLSGKASASALSTHTADSTIHTVLGETSTTAYRGDRGKTAYDHSQVAHLALGETDTTAYRGDRGKTAYDHSQTTHVQIGELATDAYRGDRGVIAYNHSQSAHLALGETDTTAYRGDRGKSAYDHSLTTHIQIGEQATDAYRGDRGKIAYDHSHVAHLALGETDTTAYRGDRGKTAYDHSQSAHASDAIITNQRDSVALNVWVGSQAQYDAIGSKSATVLYFVTV